MIKGIGVDIIEIARIQKAIENGNFLKRCFTINEIALFKTEKYNSMAANFAAKEAVSKALRTGFSGFSPADIEILRNTNGAPYVILHGGAKAKAEELGINHIHISLSHSEQYSIAYATAEGSALFD